MELQTPSTEHEASWLLLPSALQLLAHLGVLSLAIFLLVGQSLLPSRREQEVIDAFAGRAGDAPALQAGDYVEWTHSRCYGDCPAYSVRLSRQGKIEFDGGFGTCRAGIQERQIDVRQASIVLIAAELALRGSNTERSWNSDAPRVGLSVRLAGQSRQLDLTLDNAVSQLHLLRFLSEAGKVVLDPSWLPVWSLKEEPFCVGPKGEHRPFHPPTVD